jgi:alanine or glycine:cation symporter, AGCS family
MLKLYSVRYFFIVVCHAYIDAMVQLKGYFMTMASLELTIDMIRAFAWGWPLIIFVIFSGAIITVALQCIQLRYFAQAWRYVFKAEQQVSGQQEAYITPFQAFVNTLSASIGNGSTAGMATAIYSGGPGAAFWIFVLGFFTMAIRFAEVYASTYFIEKSATGVLRGGPMIYLKRVPGGSVLPYIYSFFCLMLSFVSGNAMQCNSIALGVERMIGVDTRVVAFILFVFLLYVMFGGAQRIINVSDKIVPVKVGLFFIATLIVLVYHYQMIWSALVLIVKSAFTSRAVTGGLIGYSVQDAIRFGMSRSLNATEAGLGTAGVLFGTTATKDPMRSGIMSMASTFISNHLVCVMLMVVLVASGVWNSGLTSTKLTIAAYETVFGSLGGWVVTFLSMTFGMGVLVAYAYIGRECWSFLTGGRAMGIYTALYCIMAAVGSLAQVALVWSAIDIVNAGLLIVNLYGLLMLLPTIRSAVIEYRMHN